jgi:hypothetical protein
MMKEDNGKFRDLVYYPRFETCKFVSGKGRINHVTTLLDVFTIQGHLNFIKPIYLNNIRVMR